MIIMTGHLIRKAVEISGSCIFPGSAVRLVIIYSRYPRYVYNLHCHTSLLHISISTKPEKVKYFIPFYTKTLDIPFTYSFTEL